MDTAGQEKFDALNLSYYKRANGCLLVYDVTSKESFEKIKDYYVDKLKKNCKYIIKVILLGNKTDLKYLREVTQKEGADLAKENGFIFMETSCKDNYNVSDAFTTLIEMTNSEMKKNEYIKNDNFNINDNLNQNVKTKKKKKEKILLNINLLK